MNLPTLGRLLRGHLASNPLFDRTVTGVQLELSTMAAEPHQLRAGGDKPRVRSGEPDRLALIREYVERLPAGRRGVEGREGDSILGGAAGHLIVLSALTATGLHIGRRSGERGKRGGQRTQQWLRGDRVLDVTDVDVATGVHGVTPDQTIQALSGAGQIEERGRVTGQDGRGREEGDSGEEEGGELHY